MLHLDKLSRISLEFEQSDLWQIACDIRSNILFSAKDHWIKHYDGVTPEGFREYVLHREAQRIKYITTMFNILDRPDMYKLEYELKDIFKQHEIDSK
jgi:hypothetical protein